MAGDMYTYLPTKAADYSTTTLTLAPSDVVVQKGHYATVQTRSDSGVVRTTYLSDTPIFEVVLRWKKITPTEANTIFDFYFDAAKAKGTGRTILWTHPSDGKTYVVRFASDFSREFLPVRNNITELILAVEGKIA